MSTNSKTRLNDVQLIRAVGSAMHGRDWRRPLARAVGVSGSLVAAVDTGRMPLSSRLRRRLGNYAAREAEAEVPRATARVALLSQLRDRFADRI